MGEPHVARSKGTCPLVPEGGNRAVVVLVPDPLAGLADRFRRLWDREWFERVPPHVSLLGPFVPVEPDEKLVFALTRALEGTAPFEIVVSGPDAFVVPELVLFFGLADARAMHALNGRLRAALPHHAPARPYHPHLTVGRFVSEENLSRALSQVKEDCAAPGSMPCAVRVEEVHLFGEDPASGVFRSIASIALSGDGS